MAKTILRLVLAALVAFGGVLLISYAAGDDAPGGVAIGLVIVLVGLWLGVSPFMRRKS